METIIPQQREGRKQQTEEAVTSERSEIRNLRKRVEKGELDWEQFDWLLARRMVARDLWNQRQKKRAFTDGLTDAANIRWFNEEFGRFVKDARRNKTTFGFLELDLDNFKDVNDQYGHIIGDEVLKETARRIKGTIRPDDFFARTGGEEFCVLLRDVNKENMATAATRLRDAFRDPLQILNKPVTISIGGALYNGESLKKLKDSADLALYEAKRTGKDRVMISLGKEGLPFEEVI